MIYMREKPCPHCGKTQEIALAVLHGTDNTGRPHVFVCNDCGKSFAFKIIIDVEIMK